MKNLEELGAELAVIDEQIITLVGKRMQLGKEVELFKRSTKQSLIRYEVEDRRIERAAEIAVAQGVNPHFARSLIYQLINETLKVEIDQLQSK